MNKLLATDPTSRNLLPEFSAYFKRLLEPVDQWILTEIIDDWRESFKDPISVADYKLFKDSCKDFLQGQRNRRKYDLVWLQNIIFISLQRYASALDNDGEFVIWVRDFVEQSANKAFDANEVVLKKLLELYNEWSDEPSRPDSGLAQPYAFYLLFQTVIEDPILKRYITLRDDNDPLKLYLFTTQNGNSILNNRINNFAVDFYKNGDRLISPVDRDYDIYSTSHFETIDLKNVHIDDIIDDIPEQRRIKITAMGIMGSGKSTAFKRIRHELARPSFERDTFSINELNVINDGFSQGDSNNFFGPLSRRAGPNKLDNTELTGKINIRNKLYDISVSDTRGGVMLETPPKYQKNLENIQGNRYPLENLLLNTDLLMVIMDPETIFYQDSDEVFTFGNLLDLIVSRLDYLFHHSKHAMIAIVFSKFDEYGSVIKGPRNLIHSTQQADLLKQYLATGKEEILDRLIAAIGNTYLSKNRDTPLQQTVMLLLERLKFLLRAIINTRKHPIINFYIVSTAAMNAYEKSHWTGVIELFNDFATYFDFLIKKKEQVKIAPPAELQGNLANFQPILEFRNTNPFDVLTVIERKEEDGEFFVIDKSKTTYSGNQGSFIDTQVRYASKYTYRVIFQDLTKDHNNSRATKEFVILIPEKPSVKVAPPVDITIQVMESRVILEWRNTNTVPILISLERKEQGIDYFPLFSNKKFTPDNYYVDISTEYGQQYFYRFRACEEANPENLSFYSAEVKTQVPLRVVQAPDSVKLSLLNDRVKLSWRNENKYAITYTIDRKTSGKSGWDKIAENVRQDADKDGLYTDIDASKGNEYSYRIRFIPLEKDSKPSDYVETGTIRTSPMAIEDLRWSLAPKPENPEFIELTWKEPQNNYPTKYKIERSERRNSDSNESGQLIELKDNFKGSLFRDSGIRKGWTYQYRIEVSDPQGGSLTKPVTDSGEVVVKKSVTWPALLVIGALCAFIFFLVLRLLGYFSTVY